MTLLTAWLVADAAAGAWTKELGEYYAKAGVELYGTTSFVRPGTSEESRGSYIGQQITAYGEAGVLPDWKGQVNVAVPFVVGTHTAEISDPLGPLDVRATTARMGDLRVTTQVALHKQAPVSVALEVKLPLYSNDSVGDPSPTLRAVYPLPGDGQVDFTGWLGAGGSWGPTFAEAALGYRHRTEWFVAFHPPADIAFVDGITWVLKGGHWFGKVLLLAGTEGIVSPWTGTPDGGPNVTREFASLFASGLIDLGQGVAIEPRVWGEVWADNTSQGIGGGLAVSVRK